MGQSQGCHVSSAERAREQCPGRCVRTGPEAGLQLTSENIALTGWRG